MIRSETYGRISQENNRSSFTYFFEKSINFIKRVENNNFCFKYGIKKNFYRVKYLIKIR